MTPQELKEKMRLRRETAEMVKEYWAEMMPKLGEIPEPQLQGWLSRFDLETMIEGINAAMIVRSKQDAAGKKTSVQDAVNYASGAMNKLRPVDPEKATHISEARSKAGKLGRAKQLAEGAKACQDFAQVCPDLPEVAQTLPNANGFGFDSGFGVDIDFAVDCDHEVASLPPDASRRTVTPNEEQKQNPEPTPFVVSGAGANKNRKPKTAADGTPYPAGFNNWTNAERLDWLAQHSATVSTGPCVLCGKTNGEHTNQCLKFQAMAPRKSLIGLVPEL